METTFAQSVVPWRVTFALAALYNVAFGVWAATAPLSFFDVFDLARPNYPGIWLCLGMVIGIYGLGYAYIAWKPAHGDVLALLGLIGKVLGPAGWLIAVHNGDLPARTFPLILCNDLIWWYPFTMYLLRRAPQRRVIVVALIVLFHVAGAVMLLVVRDGTEAQPSIAARMDFIRTNTSAWVACWLLWVAASCGLIAFFVLWARTLAERGASNWLLMASCAVAIVGLGFDLTNEVILIATLTEPGLQLEAFALWARRATLYGAGFGNGYYCVAGVMMTIIAIHSRTLRGVMVVWAWLIWMCGLVLSGAAFGKDHIVMTMAGAALMLLFIPWLAAMGLRFSRPLANTPQ